MKTRNWKFLIAGIFGLAVVSLFSGCHKKTAQELAEQKALERHEHEEQQIATLRKGGWGKTPAGASTLEAIKFLSQLHHSGRLPGSEDARPSVQFHINLSATNYPISRTFNVRTKSGAFTIHYTVTKNSADSSWQLQKAWRTDAQNKTVKMYSVDNLTN
ncbi:MAG: hypothetical protein ACREFE_13605 [Limisphaerales bacterium]